MIDNLDFSVHRSAADRTIPDECRQYGSYFETQSSGDHMEVALPDVLMTEVRYFPSIKTTLQLLENPHQGHLVSLLACLWLPLARSSLENS